MILNKPIRDDISIKDVNTDFKAITEHLKGKGHLTFKDFSDYELFIYCITDTYNFGRSFKDSVKNALYHLENKEKYLNLLITPDKEANFI